MAAEDRRSAMDARCCVDIVLFTIVAKAAAHPSGLQALVFGTAREAEAAMRDMEASGLQRGRDFAYATMMKGPVQCCDGIGFRDMGNCAVPRWEAFLLDGAPSWSRTE